MTETIRTHEKSKFSVFSFMMQFDWFSQAVPGFMIIGKPAISSRLGTSLTFIAGVVVIIYAISKYMDLQTLQGCTITSFDLDSSKTETFEKNFGDINFKVAVAFVGLNDNELKNDPQFVR